jgi:hypothetical protein
LAKAKGSEVLTTALGSWTTQLWETENQDGRGEAAPWLYIDGHRKPVYAGCSSPRGLVGRRGKILGGRALALLHDSQGHPRLATTSRGDQHLTVGLPQVLTRYEQAGGKTANARLIVVSFGMAAPFLRDLAAAGSTIVTLLKTNQDDGLTSFTEVGEFVPLSFDRKGQVIREVAPACFELPLPDQKDQVLPLRVALMRDLRRQIPCEPPEEDSNEELGLPCAGYLGYPFQNKQERVVWKTLPVMWRSRKRGSVAKILPHQNGRCMTIFFLKKHAQTVPFEHVDTV